MIYTIADIATGLFESIVTFMFFSTFMEKRDGLKDWVYVLGAIGLTICINISNVLFNFGFLNVLFIIVLTIIASMLYKGNIKTKIIVSVVIVFLSAGIEILVLYMITSIGHYTTEEVVENPTIRLLGIILSKTVYFITAKIVSLKHRKVLYKMPTGYWIMFFSMLISVGLAMGMIFLFQYYNSIAYMDILSVITILGLMYSFLLTLYMYERVSVQAEELAAKAILTEQLQSQKKHIDEMFMAQNKIKKVRHDLKNHIIALRAFFKNGDCQGGEEYLDNLHFFANIEGETIDTGNIVIDTILTAKKEMALSKSISFDCHIQIPEKVNIDAADLCVLLGNILDNAIEACERVKDKKSIQVSVVYKQGLFMCKVVNTAPDENNPLLKTTKDNKKEHGIGLSSVKSILDKYESTLNIERTVNQFSISFVIFI